MTLANISPLTIGICAGIVLWWLLAIIVLLIKRRRIAKDIESCSLEDERASNRISQYLKSIVGKGASEHYEEYVNLGTIAPLYKANLHMWQAYPGIFTSLGILGTFWGLSNSVADFNSADASAIRASIESLLSGMGTAFLTSLCGMAAALLYTLFEKWAVNSLSKDLDSLCQRLDNQTYISPDKHLENSLEAISTQISSIDSSFKKNIEEVFNTKIVPMMEDLTQKLENPAQTVVDSLVKEFQRICDNFAGTLTESVNNKMEELLQQMIVASESMNKLPAVINNISEQMKQAYDGVVKEIEESIQLHRKATEESIEQRREYDTEVQSQYANLGNHIKLLQDQLNEQMKGIPAMIETASEQMRLAYDGVVKEIEESIELHRKATEESIEQRKEYDTEVQSQYANLGNHIKLLQDQLNEQMKGIPAMIETASEQMKLAYDGVVKEIEEAIEQRKEYDAEVMKQYSELAGQIDNLKDVSQMCAESVKAITEVNKDISDAKSDINNLASKIRSTCETLLGVEKELSDNSTLIYSELSRIQEYNSKIISDLSDYESLIQGVEKGMQGVFAEIENGLKNYVSVSRKGMQDLLDTFTTSVTNATGDLSNSTNRLHETINSVFASMTKMESLASTIMEGMKDQAINQ